MAEQATDEQRAIIAAPLDQHIKVVAVAGSGKSWTMCHRVAHLLRSGMAPSHVLVLMFNKSAQIEFDRRLKHHIPSASLPQTRTYHSLGFRLCDTLSRHGLLPAYTLNSSTAAQAHMARQALRQTIGQHSNEACNPNRPEVVEDFLTYIDRVKSDLLEPAAVFDLADINPQLAPFIEAFEVFETLRKEQKQRFFSDLIYEPVQQLRESRKARALVTNRLKQIIVDEYQDINRSAQELIKILAGDTACVTVVGDDDQTIYEFRGSQPDYLISRFDKDFPNPLLYRLSRTFRYGHAISLAANNVISHNDNRIVKLCLSANTTPTSSIEMYTDPADTRGGGIAQAAILKPIQGWAKQGRPYRDIAVLLRVFSMAPQIELSFIRAGIPYRLDGGSSVFELREVQTLVDVLSMADGRFFRQGRPSLKEGLQRILSLPNPGMSQNDIAALADRIARKPQQLTNIVATTAARYPSFIGSRLNRKAEMITALQEKNSGTPHDALSTYLQYTDCIKQLTNMASKNEEAEKQIAAIEAFVAFCQAKVGDIGELLSDIETHRLSQQRPKPNRDAVLITSVHRAKGLEWPMVIVPRLAEGLFPFIREDGEVDIQAERRLFYVAMTRATQKLVFIVPSDEGLAHAIKYRRSAVPAGLYGNKARASRFIYEANLKPCIELANALQQGATHCEISALGEEPGLFNEYLAKLGAHFRLSKAS